MAEQKLERDQPVCDQCGQRCLDHIAITIQVGRHDYEIGADGERRFRVGYGDVYKLDFCREQCHYEWAEKRFSDGPYMKRRLAHAVGNQGELQQGERDAAISNLAT